MAVFTYKATSPTADAVAGSIVADTPRQARDLLRARGLVVQDIVDHTVASPAKRHFSGRGATSASTTLFIRELSTLLSVGVPLLEALDTLSRQHTGRFHSVILRLRDRVAAGSSLGDAMREQPRVFDDLAINITAVGEDAGTLDSSLERLAEFRERAHQLRNRVGTTLIYPAIVLTTAVAATLFLMTFVVPRILQPLIEQGIELPLPTRVVRGFSDFLVRWWWMLLAAIAAVSVAFTAILRTKSGCLWWHRTLLGVPLLGDLIRKQALIRICVVLSTLLKSGVVFLRAIEIAQRTTTNLVLRDALDRCARAVAAGADIAAALEQTRAFPPMAVQVFALGQQSGRLEEMLDRLAVNYDQQLSSATSRLTALLEPALILLLALIVLFIVLATVLPILEAGNAIQ